MSDRRRARYERVPTSEECWRICDLLRQRRLDLGLSQEQLAGQMDVPRRMLCRWEEHENCPNLASLVNWARALDCKVTVGVMWWGPFD